MKQVGLDPDLKRHVRKYSLGMRQRLGLAQAIMENPKILILDEPFNGLDKDGVKEMREYLLSYKERARLFSYAHTLRRTFQCCAILCMKWIRALLRG